MLKCFKSKCHSLLGIDLNPSAIKIVEFSNLNREPYLNNYAYEPLSLNLGDKAPYKESEHLTACIERLITQINPLTKSVALAASDSTVLSKTIQFADNLSDLEIEELVFAEAAKYLPGEVNIDFIKLGRSERRKDLIDVMLIASRAENINKRVEAIQGAGLDVKFVDVESFAVARAVRHLLAKDTQRYNQAKIIAVIDIGILSAHLYILEEGWPIYTKEEHFGARQLAKTTAQGYPSSAKEIMRSFLAETLMQIKKSLQLYYSTNGSQAIEHIFLAGEQENLAKLASLVQEEITIPTSVINPFKYLVTSNHLRQEGLKDFAPSFLIACGLALRGINESH